MRSGMLATVLLAAAALWGAPAAWAQPDDAHAPSDAKHPTVLGSTSDGSQDAAAERHFAIQAALDDLLEERMGRLASERARSSSVVEFGRTVERDAAQDRQVLDAAAKGVTPLPDTLDQARRQVLARLQAVQGNGFDDAYLSAVQKNHGHLVEGMQTEAKGGRNQGLIFYAQRQLPVMQAHTDEAKDLQTRAPGGTKGPPPAIVSPGTQQELQHQQTQRLKREPATR